MSKTYERGRDAETGRFIPVEEAKRRKKTAIVETVRKKRVSEVLLHFGSLIIYNIKKWSRV